MQLKFKDIMPPLTEEEFRQLEQNILADGIRDPLVVWGDVLVDGHNRYAIAQKHGLKFVVRNHDFESDEAAVAWIIQNQQGRRNLTPQQRIEIAERARPELERMAKERQIRKPESVVPNWAPQEKGKTRDKIAQLSGVGHATVGRAQFVKNHGSAEIIEKMQSNKISINKAYETVKAAINRPPTPKYNQSANGEPITEKTCSVCGLTLPVDRFYFSKGRLSGACKQCETAKKSFGISPNIREDIGKIQAATDFMTDTERVIDYSIEDVIEIISVQLDQFIRVTETEVTNHIDLIKNPANKDALIKALERGVCQIQTTIKNLAR